MITVLNDSNGKWCSDAKILREQVAAYFTRLFECSTVPTGSYPTRNQFPTISQIDFDSLGNIPTWDEIREALDSMRNWDIIRDSVCAMVQRVYNGAALDPELNRTCVVLIPKINNLETFSYQ
ncbi:hypothetical protein V6N13_099928 [Hibiscus sabdariffa]|uniref:Uncharacterized protein n=2 Tax=Hibiscus sabdariffa TaxID=183260 RepID=A0ABR2A568_9ROSI